jgi:hypothetical protein
MRVNCRLDSFLVSHWCKQSCRGELQSAKTPLSCADHGKDAAGANDRLEAHFEAISNEKRLKAHKHCSLHQNQLVEAFLLLVLGAGVLSRLYSLVLLLHAQGYFLRMLRWVARFEILEACWHHHPHFHPVVVLGQTCVSRQSWPLEPITADLSVQIPKRKKRSLPKLCENPTVYDWRVFGRPPQDDRRPIVTSQVEVNQW